MALFKGHPWENEPWAIEYYWYLARGYVFNVIFEVNFKPFLEFCKKQDIKPNELLMKVCSRLSKKYLPQYVVALNKKAYPAKYTVGYVRKISPDRDMLEWVAIREKKDCFEEQLVKRKLPKWRYFMMVNFPRLSLFLVKWFFPKIEIKDQYALMLSRNPLRNLGCDVVFHGTHYRTFVLTIPFGEKVKVTFGAPHAFGNIDYYEPFLKEFKSAIESPEKIPTELLQKQYKASYPVEG